MKEFVVTLLQVAVLLEAWCTIAVRAQKEKIIEDDHLKGKDWEGGAKLLFTCKSRSRHLPLSSEALDLKMECFELDTKHHRESGEKYALNFVFGTCKLDVFYSPSCDKKKILKSFQFRSLSLNGNCYRTYLIYNDEKDTDQMIQYMNFEGTSHKTKTDPESIKTFESPGGWDSYLEDNCVDGKLKEDDGHKEDEHKGESNNQKDLEKSQKAEVHKDKDHKEVEKNKDPKDQSHQEGGQKKEEHKDPKHEEGGQNKAEGAVKKTGK